MSYAKWRVFKGFQLCCSYEVAPEQKARTTYDNILRLVKDPEVCDPIRFLRKGKLYITKDLEKVWGSFRII